MAPIVVKLGGSLNRDSLLRDWLQLLVASGGGNVVVVPGGGAFADEVRRHQALWAFDDLTAHNMAILAMMQSAQLMKSLVEGLAIATTPADIARVLKGGAVAVWSPGEWIRDRPDDLTHWGASSDSLAGWLAHRLDARALVLVKSCDIRGDLDLAAQADEGVVDAEFCRITANAGYAITLLGKHELTAMRTLL